MARTGRFGRRRGGSQNLSALIASLIREQRQAEDRAIFDAYNNGGMFKGKPVTDKRLLKYIEDRRNGFSADDPLYDEWNNRLIQTKFSIGEQEIGLAFKEGRVGAGAVASWYRRQLQNIPRNSGFYREVAGRAAEWAQSAASAARGRARSSATAGLNSRLTANYKRQSAYLTIDAWLTEYAKRAGIIAGNQTLTDADATDLRDLINQGLPGPDGTPITFDEWRSASRDYYRALGQEIDILRAAGRGVIEKSRARQKFLSQTLIRQNALDDREKYEAARDEYEARITGANGDPYAVLKANEEYAKDLAAIRDGALKPDGMSQNDPEFIGGLNNEITAVLTGEVKGATVTDLQRTTTEAVSNSDTEQIAEQSRAVMAAVDDLNNGRAFFGQVEPGGAFTTMPFPAGAATDPFRRKGLDDSYQPAITRINGENRVVYLKGAAINASVVMDAEGRVVDPNTLSPDRLAAGLRDGTLSVESDNERQVGYVFTNPINGTTKYGVLQADGSMLFTERNPFASGLFNIAGVTGLTVFGNAIEEDRGDGRIVPISGSSIRVPLSLQTNADSFLTDSTVAPKDLLALAESGALGLTEDEIAAYGDRVRRDAQRQLDIAQQREMRLTKSDNQLEDFRPPSALEQFTDAAQQSWLAQGLRAVADTIATSIRSQTHVSPSRGVPAPPKIVTAPVPVAPKPIQPKPKPAPKPPSGGGGGGSVGGSVGSGGGGGGFGGSIGGSAGSQYDDDDDTITDSSGTTRPSGGFGGPQE